MTTNYQLDGGNVTQEPHQCEWAPKRIIGIDHTGAPHYGPYRSCTLLFDVMTEANFDDWAAADDGAPHSMDLPGPDDGAFTTFNNVYLYIRRARRADINVYDIEVEVTRVLV